MMLMMMTSRSYGEVPAHVQSEYGQLVTSSTLSWVRSGLGVTLPPGAVSSGTGDGVLCRGHVHGVLVAGFTTRSRCMVPGTSGKLVTLTSYHVLTHVASSSKLKWMSYERFSTVPTGAVAGLETGDVVFVGRKLDGGLMRTALVELGSAKNGGFGGRIAVYSADEAVHLVTGCDILVEVEPVRYHLNIISTDKKPKKTSHKTVLASSSMFRFQEGTNTMARMTKMVSYTYEKSLYFGHIKGAIKGLTTKIKMPTGESRSIVWGTTEVDKQSESIMVEFNMNKNTAVDFDIVADQVQEEQSWTGVLEAVFSDGSRRERTVEGVTLTSYLDMIQPQYSSPHAIKQQFAPASATISHENVTNSSMNVQNPLQQEHAYNLVVDSSIDENSSVQIHSKIVLPMSLFLIMQRNRFL